MALFKTDHLSEGFMFPEIFITGELPKDWSRESLIADGLCAWGCCMAGAKPPANFGHGMVLLSEKVGTAIPDELMALAKEITDKPTPHETT